MKNKNIYYAIFVIIALGAVYYFFFRENKDDTKKVHKQTNEPPIKHNPVIKHPKDAIEPRHRSDAYYIVLKGDTLWQIAKKYGLEKKEIMKLNPTIKDPNIIRIGQKIRIK